MAYSKAREPLTPLQQDVLDAFFEREQAFFLTGGAALAGYYLHHRSTTDLDLFTLDDAAFERCSLVLADLAASLGGTVKAEVTAPRFRRSVVSRAGDSVVVDCVRDSVFQLDTKKATVGGVRLDSQEEIFANKIATVIGRMEERDLVDLYVLEHKAGLSLESALQTAQQKDASCTPATLAWLLSEIRIPPAALLPGNVTGAELGAYLQRTVDRIRRLAFPKGEGQG